MSHARHYHRRLAIDALSDGYVRCGLEVQEADDLAAKAVDRVIHYAEVVALGDDTAVLRARLENLRAALATIQARAERGAESDWAFTAFAPIADAARGALEADDKAAHPLRTFVAGPDGHTEEITHEVPKR